jgi:transposase
MVKKSYEVGIPRAAKEFNVTAATVRKWRRRYEREGPKGLEDRSRRPHHSPNRTPPEVEAQVVALRKGYPTWGAKRLVEVFELPVSAPTVYNILRRHNAYKPRRRRWRERRDLRERKKRWRFLGKIQLDAKDLTDIPAYWEAWRRLGLPRYQFTARDVRTGMVVVALAYELSLTNGVMFARYVAAHLRRFGGQVTGTIWQTDNGSEFTGGGKTRRRSPFTEVVARLAGRHVCIPPRSPTFNSDVEAFHRLVQNELWMVEDFATLQECWEKLYAYVTYFNRHRTNSYRDNLSPYAIAASLDPNVDPHLFAPPPVILDFFDPETGEYNVPCPDK